MGTPAKNYLFCLVSGKQRAPLTPKKPKEKRELILGKMLFAGLVVARLAKPLLGLVFETIP